MTPPTAGAGRYRHELFLCHAAADELHARALFDCLRDRYPRLPVFLAVASLHPGDSTRVEIPRAQEASRITVAMFSSRSDDGWYNGAEIARAIELHRDGPDVHRVIPLRLDATARRPFGLEHVLEIAQGDERGLEAVADRLAAEVERLRARAGSPAPVDREADAALAAWRSAGVARHARIRIVGFREQHKITLPLDHVYVPLGIEGLRLDEHAPARRTRPAAGDDREPLAAVDGERLVTIERAMTLAHESVCGLVLLGYPGAGKTTILRHLFWRVATGRVDDMPHLRGLHPILIRLANVTDDEMAAPGRGSPAAPRGLGALLAREAETDGHPDAARPFLGAKPPPVLFLLDGLDEVRDEATRVRLCRWLVREVRAWPGSAFVVTSRPAAWKRSPDMLACFRPTWVQGLDPEAAAAYVSRWFGAVEHHFRAITELPDAIAARAKRRAAALLEVLADPRRRAVERMAAMTSNPLMLSTLCLVHYRDRRLPDQRGELYERALGLLLETWVAERSIGDDVDDAARPRLSAEDARLVLQPLAYAMQERDVRELPHAEAAAEVRAPLAQVPALRAVAPTAEAFLDLVRDECGVLAARDLGQIEFIHLSFQEYLAAGHVAERGLAADLAARAGDPRWEEVILLAMSLPGVFRPFMEAVLARGDVAALHALLRQCLAEARRIDPRPFEAAADQLLLALRGTDTAEAASRLRALFALAQGFELPGLVERARSLGDRGGLELRLAARALAGAPEATATRWTPGEPVVEPVTGMSLRWVPKGRFVMGSDPARDPERYASERPAHPVVITQGFWMGEHPVTNDQYRAFVEATGHRAPPTFGDRRFNDRAQPVVGVDWNDARAFCAWLDTALDRGGAGFARLPTEAEWEYAARGVDGRLYPWGSTPRPDAERATFGQPRDTGKPSPVGQHPLGQSPFGLHDLAGNVWEWCQDVWRDDHGSDAEVVDPCHHVDNDGHDPDSLGGAPRVVRGGSWNDNPWNLRCACRSWIPPGNRLQDVGFRVVCGGSRQHGA